MKTRWWFQTLFMFIPTWGNDPIWLIFFKWVETTNKNISIRKNISKIPLRAKISGGVPFKELTAFLEPN